MADDISAFVAERNEVLRSLDVDRVVEFHRKHNPGMAGCKRSSTRSRNTGNAAHRRAHPRPHSPAHRQRCSPDRGRMTHWRYTLGGIVIAGCIVAGVLYWIGKAAGNAFGWW